MALVSRENDGVIFEKRISMHLTFVFMLVNQDEMYGSKNKLSKIVKLKKSVKVNSIPVTILKCQLMLRFLG